MTNCPFFNPNKGLEVRFYEKKNPNHKNKNNEQNSDYKSTRSKKIMKMSS